MEASFRRFPKRTQMSEIYSAQTDLFQDQGLASSNMLIHTVGEPTSEYLLTRDTRLLSRTQSHQER